MKASAEPKTLKVTFTIDGELAHERVVREHRHRRRLVRGRPAAQGSALDTREKSAGLVRMMTRKAKRFSFPRPSRFSVCVSTTPKNRFASRVGGRRRPRRRPGPPHRQQDRQAGRHHLHADRMSGKDQAQSVELKSWIRPDDLKLAPSLMEDYKDLGAVRPGNPYYDANVRRYIAAWKKYWGEYIPQMMATKRVPDGVAWGSYPTLAALGHQQGIARPTT